MVLNGAQIVIACLEDLGVDTVFGFPGGAVIPLYDVLYDHQGNIKHYRTCHEQGAVHAADGYARSTGKVGVCFVTSGPGATNTITGLATAYLDSQPVVVISGQVATPLIGKDSFQEVDITSMTLTITKHCEMVRSIDQLESVLFRAFDIAMSGRPGPVLIDIPKDLMTQTISFNGIEAFKQRKRDKTETIGDANDLMANCVAQLFEGANHPVILAGGGVIHSGAHEALYELATACKIPVANTLMGSGAFPQSHPLSLGLAGMHGSRAANQYLASADLVMVLGARLSDRVIGAPDQFCGSATIIHVENDENEIHKNKQVQVPVRSDIKTFLKRLNGLLINRVKFKDPEGSFKQKITRLEGDALLSPMSLLKMIKDAYGDEAIVVTEVGQHQMWTAQAYGFDHVRSLITSGGLGTMGFGLGAAIGAKVGNPHRTVLHFAGDGSFKMNCNELGTVSKYQVPITTFIFNNKALGMVRQWQKLFNHSRYSETDGDDSVDFIKLAGAYGIKGIRVTTVSELGRALEWIKKEKQPVVVDCVLDCDENVFPIIPPGKGLSEIIEGSMISHES